MTTTTKLFKLEVTYPADAYFDFSRCADCDLLWDDGDEVPGEDYFDHDWRRELNPSWRPDGWLSDPDIKADWVDRFGDEKFFWPKADKIYFTKGTAQKRARLLESYGATVKIIESDPIVWLTPEVIRSHRIDQLEKELELLRLESLEF